MKVGNVKCTVKRGIFADGSYGVVPAFTVTTNIALNCSPVICYYPFCTELESKVLQLGFSIRKLN